MYMNTIKGFSYKTWVFLFCVALVFIGGYFVFINYLPSQPFLSQNEEKDIEQEVALPIETGGVVETISSQSLHDPQGQISEWTVFNSKYFNLSFEIPSRFDVYDSKNYIAVAEKKYEVSDIGSNNAFFSIRRFDRNFTKEKAIADARRLLKNIKESQITIDGAEFLKIEADDYGRYEGVSAGKIVEVFFEKSLLHVESGRSDAVPTFDVLTVAEKIISTVRFSSATKWKTYANAQYGISFMYPSDYMEIFKEELVTSGVRLFGAKYESGYVGVMVIEQTFDFNNIQGLYGKVENSELRHIGTKIGYANIDGDAGCAATRIQTGLGQRTLLVSFSTCEMDDLRGLYTDRALQDEILSTFEFDK